MWEELKNKAIQIREEFRVKANTAFRIGDLLKKLIDKAESIEDSIPTVNNSTVILQQGGSEKGRFTLNQASPNPQTINFDLDSGGSDDFTRLLPRPMTGDVHTWLDGANSGQYVSTAHTSNVLNLPFDGWNYLIGIVDVIGYYTIISNNGSEFRILIVIDNVPQGWINPADGANAETAFRQIVKELRDTGTDNEITSEQFRQLLIDRRLVVPGQRTVSRGVWGFAISARVNTGIGKTFSIAGSVITVDCVGFNDFTVTVIMYGTYGQEQGTLTVRYLDGYGNWTFVADGGNAAQLNGKTAQQIIDEAGGGSGITNQSGTWTPHGITSYNCIWHRQGNRVHISGELVGDMGNDYYLGLPFVPKNSIEYLSCMVWDGRPNLRYVKVYVSNGGYISVTEENDQLVRNIAISGSYEIA